MVLPKQRKIGLEQEFLAVDLETGQAISRDQIKQIWKKWGESPHVDTYFDYGTRQAVGVKYHQKDGREVVINTDAGVDVVEFGFLPFPTLQEAEKNAREIIREFQEVAQESGVGLISYGLQPKTPYFYPDLKSEKMWYRGFVRLYERGHSGFHNIAANQPNIDLTLDEAIPAVNMANALSPLFIALFANSGAGEYKIQEHHEQREHRWNLWMKGEGRREKISGIAEHPFESFEDYFEYNWTIPLPAVHRGSTQYVIDSNPEILEYLESGKDWDALDVGPLIKPVKVRPEVQDINQSLQYIWIQARLKLEFENDFTIEEILTAWKNKKLRKFMEKYLNKLYLEARCIAQQPWEDIIAPAALILGLIENLEKADKLAKKRTWEQWRQLREQTLTASLETPGIEDDLARMLDIAEKGLKKRKFGEEKYLKCLWERLEKKQSPAIKAIKIFRSRGPEGLLKEVLIPL